ncbi:hypothetical protein OKJ48_12070 [Streptomyces kunmingensis]|uniref:Uncharacterized protein n=1 Tax=Streptomyces kunmingensis TaxID=68225 RepID=A0ABU6C9X6_9ACTN|nr:hypothetical protein [Streptomyces kunmingensis]MEB3960977.1 hypothetical protein [Streptomyces kunmingensis]
MSTRPRAPHPAETNHEVRGRVRTCRPARRDGRDAAEPEAERDPDWNLVRGED